IEYTGALQMAHVEFTNTGDATQGSGDHRIMVSGGRTVTIDGVNIHSTPLQVMGEGTVSLNDVSADHAGFFAADARATIEYTGALQMAHVEFTNTGNAAEGSGDHRIMVSGGRTVTI